MSHLQCLYLNSHLCQSPHTVVGSQGAGSPWQLSSQKLLQLGFPGEQGFRKHLETYSFCVLLPGAVCPFLSRQGVFLKKPPFLHCHPLFFPVALRGHYLAKQSLGHACLLLSILPKQTSPKERPKHGHLLRDTHTQPSPQWGLCVAMSSATPTHLLKETCMRPHAARGHAQRHRSERGTTTIWQNLQPDPNLQACTFHGLIWNLA